MKQPQVIEVFADNGAHSHWTLIDIETGEKLWSEAPEECKAMGYPVIEPLQVKDPHFALIDEYHCPPIEKERGISISCDIAEGFDEHQHITLNHGRVLIIGSTPPSKELMQALVKMESLAYKHAGELLASKEPLKLAPPIHFKEVSEIVKKANPIFKPKRKKFKRR